MADSKHDKPAARPTVDQDEADRQAIAQKRQAVPTHLAHPPAPRDEPTHSPMLDRDRQRLADLRAMLPPQPRPRTPEEEREMRMLEEREEKAAQSEWAKQDARVLELQQRGDHRTPEEEAELARLVREIDQQDRAVKRAEGVKP
jgi:hypothetical protein